MAETPEAGLHNGDPIERLENVLVRMAFILEQRESRAVQRQKQKEAEIASVTGQIDALEARIAAFLQELPSDRKEN